VAFVYTVLIPESSIIENGHLAAFIYMFPFVLGGPWVVHHCFTQY